MIEWMSVGEALSFSGDLVRGLGGRSLRVTGFTGVGGVGSSLLDYWPTLLLESHILAGSWLIFDACYGGCFFLGFTFGFLGFLFGLVVFSLFWFPTVYISVLVFFNQTSVCFKNKE